MSFINLPSRPVTFGTADPAFLVKARLSVIEKKGTEWEWGFSSYKEFLNKLFPRGTMIFSDDLRNFLQNNTPAVFIEIDKMFVCSDERYAYLNSKVYPAKEEDKYTHRHSCVQLPYGELKEDYDTTKYTTEVQTTSVGVFGDGGSKALESPNELPKSNQRIFLRVK